MIDRRIVSPRFIGRMAGAPLRLAQPGDKVIKAAPGAGSESESLAPIHIELADAVADAIRAGERPVAIVGDCCQAIPLMAGLARNGVHPSIVWLDSHGDFNTWETTPSGFLGGMPLAMLTGRGDQGMMEAVGLDPISDQRVLLSDGRDLDPEERELVKASRIRHMEGVIGVPYVLPDGPLYLHIDADIIDSRLAPAFLYAVKGGPSPEGLRSVIEGVLASGRVVAISVTASWDAAKDEDRVTETAVRRAVQPLLAG
ncbi:arginase family protein [Aestuariivirga sp.]|uniref:arginase family protein n=1 Tax=Aestuariivirga sp. TaxID=2650926 RepID=UPI00359469DE